VRRSYSSYYARRADAELNTGRQLDRTQLQAHAKRLGRFWLQRFGLAVLLLAAIICLISVLTLTPSANLQLPKNSGQTWLRPTSAYQEAADQLLASSIWNRNKITINTAHLSAAMAQRFPELSGVSVALPLIGHRPVVYLEPATAALILSGPSGSYVIGANGRALVAVTPAQSIAKLGLPVITDQSGVTLKVGSQALSSTAVRFIQVVVAELTAKSLSPGQMILPAAASELDVHLNGKPYFVKFNLHNDDPRQQAGTFLATIANLQGKGITPAQYVDVRVDGRAYYQ
jgi:hypothetical protein